MPLRMERGDGVRCCGAQFCFGILCVVCGVRFGSPQLIWLLIQGSLVGWVRARESAVQSGQVQSG